MEVDTDNSGESTGQNEIDNDNKDNFIEVIKQDVPIDHTEFNKYIATFDIVLFGLDDTLIKLENASCIFLAKDIMTAKYRSCFEMFQTCLLEGMPVKSMDFVCVSVCDNNDINVDALFPNGSDNNDINCDVINNFNNFKKFNNIWIIITTILVI